MKLLQGKKARKVIRFIPMYLMMLPGIIYFLINNYMPMPGLLIAFKKFKFTKGVWGSPWCGISNFSFLIKSQDLSLLVRNTLLYNLVFLVLGTVLSVTVAILLNEVQRKKL